MNMTDYGGVPLFVQLLLPPTALGRTPPTEATPPRTPRKSTDLSPAATGNVHPDRPRVRRACGMDHGHTLSNHEVALTGFGTPGAGAAWSMTRMHIVSCAADALAVKVEVASCGQRQPTNQWASSPARAGQGSERSTQHRGPHPGDRHPIQAGINRSLRTTLR